MTGDEACDDGEGQNGNGTSTCTANCTLDTCGDGYVATGSAEECDEGDANGNGTSTCSASCTLNVCGDGYAGPGEACDDGDDNGNGTSLCKDDCTVNECGDGYQAGSEACDDGADNGNGTSLCKDDCTVNECGDGYEAGTEECDEGNSNGNGTSLCTDSCTLNECGDGYLAGGEVCEVNSSLQNASCNGSCQVVCDFGFDDCSGSALSCETAVNTNQNCGGCGDACTTLGGGAGSTVACNAQTLLCDATVVYQITEDATVVDDGATPLGGTAALITDAGGGNDDYSLGLLRASTITANIPTTATITGVTLGVRVVSAGSTATLREVTTTWAEGTVTGTNFDRTTGIANASQLEGTTPAVANATFSNFSGTALTALVQSWVSGSKSNFGVALLPTGNAETSWDSKEQNSSRRPSFTINVSYDAGDL